MASNRLFNLSAGILMMGALGACVSAQARDEGFDMMDAAGNFMVEEVASGLEFPWALAFLPDGDMLVTEREGRLRLIDDGKLVEQPIAGVPEVLVRSQGGLFDVVLARDFATSGELYLAYAEGTRRENGTAMIRARLENGALVDQKLIFRAQPDKDTGAHFGGRIVVLPDNTLLLSLGDGFLYREEAQNKASHIGTIVRVDRDGNAPSDNPFVGQDDAAPEVWSYGHRNVQGLIHDPVTGHVWAHEHGAQGGDEINLIKPGKNYGWPFATTGLDYTGAKITPYTSYPGTEPFVHDWVPSIAPSGFVIYRGTMFPEWEGDLLVGGLASQDVRLVEMDGDKAVNEIILFNDLEERIRDVRVGPDGALYLLTDSDEGRVLRVTPKQ